MNIGGLRERLEMAQRRAALAEEACHEPWPRRRGPRTGAIRCGTPPSARPSSPASPCCWRCRSPTRRTCSPPACSTSSWGSTCRRGPLTLLLSHSLFCLSYAALTLKARLAGFDPGLELAAQDLGAPPLQAFRRVTLPLLVPGLLAAGLLSFSLSFDDYVVSSFTAGETVTLPLYLAGAYQREISPQIQVLSTLVLLASVLLLALASPPRSDHGRQGP